VHIPSYKIKLAQLSHSLRENSFENVTNSFSKHDVELFCNFLDNSIHKGHEAKELNELNELVEEFKQANETQLSKQFSLSEFSKMVFNTKYFFENYQSESYLNLREVIQSLYCFEEFQPPLPPSLDPNKEILERQYPDLSVHPFDLDIFSGKQDHSVAWFAKADGSLNIVSKGNDDQYNEVFHSVTDSQGREPYYGYNGFFEYKFYKPGEYIDFIYPIKHNKGIIEHDKNGKIQIGDHYSIVRVNLKDPKDIKVVAFDPKYDVIDCLRDPETQELIAFSFVTDKLQVKWRATDPNTQANLDELERKVRELRNLDDEEPLSLEKVKLQNTSDGKLWTIYSSSAIRPLMKHECKVASTRAIEISKATSEVNYEFNSDVKPLKLSGANGDQLSALLIIPKGKSINDLPVIVMAHGGPYNSYKNTFTHDTKIANIFVQQGYAVLMINQRGSTDNGSKFILDITDNQVISAQDVISATQDAIKKREISDRSNLHLYGHSYGGYTVAKVAEIQDGNDIKLFKTVIASAPIMDFNGDIDVMKKTGSKESSIQDLQRWIQTDGGVKPKGIKTPMLFFCGQLDDGDFGSLDQIHKFVTSLPQDTPYEVIEFENESHSPIHLHEMTVLMDKSLEFIATEGKSATRYNIVIKKTTENNPESRPRMAFFN